MRYVLAVLVVLLFVDVCNAQCQGNSCPTPAPQTNNQKFMQKGPVRRYISNVSPVRHALMLKK